MSLGRELRGFAVGGVLGLGLDLGVLQVLVSAAHCNLYLARLLSFLAAASATWGWNRRHSFQARSSGLSLGREWLHWLALMALGGICNYCIFILLLAAWPALKTWPLLPAAMGSGLAAGINFVSARGLLFRRRRFIV